MYFKPGQTVKVNKDIFRVKEWRPVFVTFPLVTSVPVYEDYAKEGDTGEVFEIFRGDESGLNNRGLLYVKVKMGDRIKTFRMTSLEIIK